MPYYGRSNRRFRKYRKKTPAKAASTKGAFTSRVLKVINRQRELKIAKKSISTLAVRSRINVSNGNVVGIFPDIPQGSNEYEREGNRIMLKKLVVNCYYAMEFPVVDNYYTRVALRHMVVKQKNSNAYNVTSGVTPFLQNNVLENSEEYTGAIHDFNTPINANAFTVKKQLKKTISAPVSRIYGQQNSGGVDKSYKLISYTLTFGKGGKPLNFRTSGSNQPSDFNYFLMHSASPIADVPFFDGASPCDFHGTITAYYYDN